MLVTYDLRATFPKKKLFLISQQKNRVYGPFSTLSPNCIDLGAHNFDNWLTEAQYHILKEIEQLLRDKNDAKLFRPGGKRISYEFCGCFCLVIERDRVPVR